MHKVGLLFFGSLIAPTGASTVLKNIVQGFNEDKEFDLKIFSLDAYGRFFEKKIKNNPEIRLMTVIKKVIHKFLKKTSKKSLFVTKIYVWLQYHNNANIIINRYEKYINDLDILFFHDIITPYQLKRKNIKLWNEKKKIVVLHSNGEIFKMLFSYYPKLKESPKTKFFYENNIAISVLNDVDQIVLLSEYAKQNFVKSYPNYIDKVLVVPNGINSSKIKSGFNFNKRKIVFTTIGSVCERKGHDVLIKAVEIMTKSERNRFDINIIGDGIIVNDLMNQCKEKEITNVKFLGTKKYIYKYLYKTDCFLLASRDEGLPIAIIEAMSIGLPIIATNVGGVPDLVIDDFNGILIAPGNVKELKSAILLFNELSFSKKISMGDNSLKLFTDGFTQKKMIEGYKNIFNKFI
jgi:glycosyltransferase involved in cell wall biosynthesis